MNAAPLSREVRRPGLQVVRTRGGDAKTPRSSLRGCADVHPPYPRVVPATSPVEKRRPDMRSAARWSMIAAPAVRPTIVGDPSALQRLSANTGMTLQWISWAKGARGQV